jgi:hypothetical protein
VFVTVQRGRGDVIFVGPMTELLPEILLREAWR